MIQGKQVVDYSAYTEAQINREIAQRLGYTVIEGDHAQVSGVRVFALLDPHGRRDSDLIGMSEELVWRDHLPPWTRDMDWATSLIYDIPYTITNDPKAGEGLRYVCRLAPYATSLRAQAYSDSEERAICEAWLYLKDGEINFMESE